MTEPRPLDVTRKDGVLVPRQRWLFDRLFAEGGDYTIEIFEPRSDKSHRHYFAVIREAWKNLPEELGKQHPDAEHLRKWSLIKCGYSIKRNVVCESTEMAFQVAAVAGQLDESAVIVVQGLVVTIATARTQKTTGPGAMTRDEFQKSKQDVIDYVAGLIGVDPSTLSSQVPDSSGGNPAQTSDRTDAPAASGPQNSSAAGASHSNLSGNNVANDPAGAPAVDPDRPAAGANQSEASLLSDDWRDVYIQNLAGIRDKATSLIVRHGEAVQMLGGEPNEAEIQWMRSAWRLVRDRNEGRLKNGEFDARVEHLKTMPLTAAPTAA